MTLHETIQQHKRNARTRAVLDSLAGLHDVTLIEPNYDSLSTRKELSSSYGDWKQIDADYATEYPDYAYAMTRYTGGSDYSGNLVEVSNHKAIIAMMPDDYEDGTDYISYHGGHGTFDVAIRLDRMTDELIDAFRSLENYCLLDESLLSEIEMESQNESWESDIRRDFQRALDKALWELFQESQGANQRDDESDTCYALRMERAETFLSDDCGNISDTDLSALCWKMADAANEYWTNEIGSGSWLDVDAVVKNSIGSERRTESEWHDESFRSISALIRSAMTDDKYTLGIVRYINPNQLKLNFVEVQ